MIILLNDADFSLDNIGQITLPQRLDDFTKAAIIASGNTNMDEMQKAALETFFTNIGAIGGGSNIFSKLEMLTLPMIADDLAYSLINYVDNSTIATPESASFTLQTHGLKATAAVTAKKFTATTTPRKNYSIGFYNTEVYDYSATRDLTGMIYNNGDTIGGFRATTISSSSKLSIRHYITNSVYFTIDVQNTAQKGLFADVFRDTTADFFRGTTVKNKTLTEAQVNAYPNTTGGNLYIGATIGYTTNIYAPPVGAAFLGAEMTTSEVETLSNALDALFAAFNV